MKRLMLLLLGVTLIALGAMGGRMVGLGMDRSTPVAAATTQRSTTSVDTSTSSIDRATMQAYATASRYVVFIKSAGVGTGSGIVYDVSGNIVTNAHVIDGASSISVTLNNGKSYAATRVGTDAADDLAVIHIDAPGLVAAPFASAGSYHVAQTVLAIGSPLGLKQSVSSGLVSALHRVEQEPNGAYLSDAVQTSAPINPGNSGGALVALDGTVVGMPTLEQTSSPNGAATQNIGFAIPSERIVSIADQMIAHGKVQHTGRPYLGIAPSDASGQSASPFDSGGTTPAATGAVVSHVSSSGPAGKAGIQQGDVITAADGSSIASAEDLLTFLAAKKPGDAITLKIDRNGTSQTVTVRLGELPA